MSGLEAQPQDTPRLVVLAHGSLRQADFRDRVAAVAHAGFDGVGLHVREYARLRSEGWSDADLRAVLAGAGVRLVEIETGLPGSAAHIAALGEFLRVVRARRKR
jgi:sugar phosphate isomerase/epimerase